MSKCTFQCNGDFGTGKRVFHRWLNDCDCLYGVSQATRSGKFTGFGRSKGLGEGLVDYDATFLVTVWAGIEMSVTTIITITTCCRSLKHLGP